MLPCVYAASDGPAVGGAVGGVIFILYLAGVIFNAIVVMIRRTWTRELFFVNNTCSGTLHAAMYGYKVVIFFAYVIV